MLIATTIAWSVAVAAQIAPECADTPLPKNYNEDAQQAYLQNYFAASFILTPMAPPVAYDTSKASIALELGFIPPVACEHRFVLNGTKTEDTDKSPVSPRPRVHAQLPKIGPVSSHVGFTFLPPVASPIGTLLQAGGELGAGWRSAQGLSVGARAHLNFARMRAEIASPINADDPVVDDLFFANSMGVDVGLGWTLPLDIPWLALAPYASAGMVDVSTLFLVGDDRFIVENTKAPYAGAIVATGAHALLFEHVEVALEGSWAIPIYPTVKAKVGVAW